MLFDLLVVLLIFTSVSARALEQLPAGWPPAATKAPTAAAASPACCTFPMQEALESSGLTFLLVKTHLAFLRLPAGNYLHRTSQLPGYRWGFCTTRKETRAVSAVLAYAGSSSLGRERLNFAAPRLNTLSPAFYFQEQAVDLASSVWESSHREKGGLSIPRQSP